jgi:hypothetical protein
LIDAFQSIGSHVVDKLIPLSLAFADWILYLFLDYGVLAGMFVDTFFKKWWYTWRCGLLESAKVVLTYFPFIFRIYAYLEKKLLNVVRNISTSNIPVVLQESLGACVLCRHTLTRLWFGPDTSHWPSNILYLI